MSSEPQAETTQETEERPRLSWVEIGGWPGLGGNVGFDVGERVTVLVGKNGAGKSLIMEGLRASAHNIIFGVDFTPPPKSFKCRVAQPGQPSFLYEFEVDDEENEGNDRLEIEGKPSRRLIWSERCQIEGIPDYLWSVANAQLTLHGKPPQDFAYNEGLVVNAIVEKRRITAMPIQAKYLAELFNGLHSVAAGIPRGSESRHEILLRRIKIRGRQRWEPISNAETPTSILALKILQMHLGVGLENSGAYDEFVELLQQLEIVREVSIHRYDDRNHGKDSYAAVHFDDINIGLCSDGTQRIAQIIAQLLSPHIRCLLIEEPETAVHPSLLARLLAILESYSLDRQIIIATHSPQIVDWCHPKDLRLVERIEGQTRVRRLDEKELGRVYNYLAHDGTLSDFVYGQSLE